MQQQQLSDGTKECCGTTTTATTARGGTRRDTDRRALCVVAGPVRAPMYWSVPPSSFHSSEMENVDATTDNARMRTRCLQRVRRVYHKCVLCEGTTIETIYLRARPSVQCCSLLSLAAVRRAAERVWGLSSGERRRGGSHRVRSFTTRRADADGIALAMARGSVYLICGGVEEVRVMSASVCPRHRPAYGRCAAHTLALPNTRTEPHQKDLLVGPT